MKENKTKRYNKLIWCELYRPQTVEDILMPKDLKKQFLKMVKQQSIPNLLLYSSGPGVGKTTLAKALCRDLSADYKYINVSSESGIDTLRSKIQKFASTKSFSGGQKVVIMDEFDGASKNLQQGLRAAIEEFHKVCRFIFTCNYITQIIGPLKSRCQEFDMNYMDTTSIKELKPEIEDRITKILKHKGIDYDIKTVKKLIDTKYPDIRKTIQLCQQYSNINGSIDKDILTFEKVDEEFYDLLLRKKFNPARRYVIEKNYDYTEMYTNLYKEFVPKLDKPMQPQVILVLAQYQHWHASVADPEINFAACLVELLQSF